MMRIRVRYAAVSCGRGARSGDSSRMRFRMSMRWWLALAFAAVAALTALAVAEVFTQRAEDAFRSRAQELTAGAAVGAAEKIKAALGHGNQATVVAAEARQRNIALFLFDRQGGLVSAARSHGVDRSEEHTSELQ